MKVTRIAISNIMGIDSMVIEPTGAVTVLEGANAAGKTSVVEALKAVFQGGHDATLLRQGAESGEVVIVFDDGKTATKTVTPSRSPLSVRDPKMGRISAPAGYLKAVTDGLWSPVKFLAAKSGRVKMVLEAVPMPVDSVIEGKIVDAIGAAYEHYPVQIPRSAGGHALHAIAAARDILYKKRTGENRLARDAATHVEQLQASLPAGDAGEAPDVEGLRVALKAAEVDRDAAYMAANDEGVERKRKARETRDRMIDAAHREYEAATAAIAADLTARGEDIRDHHDPLVEKAGAAFATAREQAKAREQHDNTRAVIAHNEAKRDEARKIGNKLTAALDRLHALREDLIEQLPIPGMELRDGDVWVDGIPFPRMNRAAQVAAAVAVAKVRAGDVPLVVFDGFECLDAESLAAFESEIEAAGLQAIVTKVTDGPLAVRAGVGE